MIYIYELRYFDQDKWHPFYVGHTTDLKARRSAHKSAAKNGHETLVYDFIRKLELVGINWDIFRVASCKDNEYTDQEDEHILELLFAGHKLENMKKGDQKWMDRTVRNMQSAKEAGCKSVKEYKVWDAEQKRIANDAKQQERLIALKAQHKKEALIEKIKHDAKFQEEQKRKEHRAKVAKERAMEMMNQIKPKGEVK